MPVCPHCQAVFRERRTACQYCGNFLIKMDTKQEKLAERKTTSLPEAQKSQSESKVAQSMNTSLDEKRDSLCRAIGSKNLVQFTYDKRVRIVEPFCCGKSTAGNYVLRAFQIRGSGKTKPLSWRMFELAEMTQLTVTRHTFSGKRDDYNPEDPVMTEMFCRIS